MPQHVVGPNFNEDFTRDQDYEWAVANLSIAYENSFKEFAQCDMPVLRLLPISGSIFAGKWKSISPKLTVDSWRSAIGRLDPAHTQVLVKKRIEMCIFEDTELAGFLNAFGLDAVDEKMCFPCVKGTVTMQNTGERLSVRVTNTTTAAELSKQVAIRNRMEAGEITVAFGAGGSSMLADQTKLISSGMKDGDELAAHVSQLICQPCTR